MLLGDIGRVQGAAMKTMGCPCGVVDCGRYLTLHGAGPARFPLPLRDTVGSALVGALTLG